MEQFILKDIHNSKDFIDSLRMEFDTESFDVVSHPNSDGVIANRILSQRASSSGSFTSLYVYVKNVELGLEVVVTDQDWTNIATSVGSTIFAAIINPINLVTRLDDIAADVTNMQLQDHVVKFIREYKHRIDQATIEIELKTTCKYCKSRNANGVTHCSACGAPL